VSYPRVSMCVMSHVVNMCVVSQGAGVKAVQGLCLPAGPTIRVSINCTACLGFAPAGALIVCWGLS
jgi:hypothetical protein